MRIEETIKVRIETIQPEFEGVVTDGDSELDTWDSNSFNAFIASSNPCSAAL